MVHSFHLELVKQSKNHRMIQNGIFLENLCVNFNYFSLLKIITRLHIHKSYDGISHILHILSSYYTVRRYWQLEPMCHAYVVLLAVGWLTFVCDAPAHANEYSFWWYVQSVCHFFYNDYKRCSMTIILSKNLVLRNSLSTASWKLELYYLSHFCFYWINASYW